MNSKIRICACLILAILFCVPTAFSQTETDTVIEQIIEDMSENMPDEFDFSEITERLNFYLKHPLDINKASADQLHELVFLTPLQAAALMQYRIENGRFIDLLELQGIDGFDELTIRRLTNFVYIGLPNTLNTLSLKRLYQQGSNDLMIRYSQYLQKQKGYQLQPGAENTAYAGTPQRVLLRYRYNYGRDISASLNMEKDAGEKFLPRDKVIGPDFSSANIFLKNMKAVKKAVIGDYSLQFGQGLALWSGLSFGKGAMITNLAKPELGLQPYKSSNETLFLRGIASTIEHRSFQLTPFISMRELDAGLELNPEGPQQIGSMSESGLHRTVTELANKNSVSQLIYGAHLKYSKHNLSTGFTAYQTNFDHPVKAGQLLYNQFNFSGSRLTNLGVNYGYTFKNTYLFGEAAYSGDNNIAFINGIMSSISSKMSVVILHRNYPQDYHSFFNQAIAEASNSVNERGLYAGMMIKPVSKVDISLYSDFFRFPWLKFGVDAPSTGYELFSSITYNPSKKTRFGLRYKFEQKQDNDALDNPVNVLNDIRKQSCRMEFSSKINKNFTLRNRLEVADYRRELEDHQTGWMAYQDVIYDPMKSRFSGNFRFALFNTPGFDSRIYAYENDVLYSYSLPAYQNNGLRFYCNGRYSVSRKTDLWLRYAISKYKDLEVIGSGNDQITGSKRSEIKVQIRYQL